jgi:2-desacetyl-2-hydroxyethyl bacteriochlorophyllide A dehydrogenase
MRRSLIFTAPRTVCVEESPVPEPAPDELLVETAVSAISAGTEMLVYRDQFPPDLSVDAAFEGMGQPFAYPVRYGYAAAGRVVAAGEGVAPGWPGRRVFAFHPHASHFVIAAAAAIPVPEGVSLDSAVFLPNMETAVNLVQDGAPRLGERVAVLGQGVVGLLVTSLLARFPLAELAAVDGFARRREAALAVGAQAAFSPDAAQAGEMDLIFELSGSPDALDLAIRLAGYGGRIVVGSWYGQKRAPIDLGGRFHRNRLQITSSQVSTVAPELSGRWDKARRLDAAWRMIGELGPERWITQRFPVEEAAAAYRLLDEQPGDALQVVLTYGPPS